MIADALKADGVEELFSLATKKAESIDIFDEDYLARIKEIKLPTAKIQLLQKLLEKAIESDFKKINQLRGSTSPAVSSRLWINRTNAGKMCSMVRNSIPSARR